MKKLWRILKSRFEEEMDEGWVIARREVCAICPYNSLNNPERTLKQKLYKSLSDFYTWITRAEFPDLGECECSCPIALKTRDFSEECYAKEEYGDDKWKSIFIPQNSNKKPNIK